MDLSILAMADLATPMAIRVAATLGLAERAGSEGATAGHLAAQTGTSPPALRRLLDHLVTIGVFGLDPSSDRFRPTSLGLQLTEDWPKGLPIINTLRLVWVSGCSSSLGAMCVGSGRRIRRAPSSLSLGS